MTPLDKLSELEKICDEATKGRWVTLSGNIVLPEGVANPCSSIEGESCIAHLDDGEYIENPNAANDSAFIAAANPATIKTLIQVIREATAGMSKASKTLNSIKYELNASVYTVEDDEFGFVFHVRDCLDIELAKIDTLIEGMLKMDQK